MLNKKALHPVVATALLLVVAVVSVVGFQGWFQTFSSTLFVDVEQRGSISHLDLGIETLVGSNLYIKAGSGLNIISILIDGNDCDVSGMYYNMSGIDVSGCLDSVSTSTPEIVLVTDKGVESKYFSFKPIVSGFTSISQECYTAPTNTLGVWPGCNGMLIVNRSMLSDAISNNQINGGEDFYISFGGQNYTFGDSQYNIFTGQVNAMNSLFFSQTTFNADINYWDVSSVTSMEGMFMGAGSFNQPLDNWDVSSVTSMAFMFIGAENFNQTLNNWNTSSVLNLQNMFMVALSFDQPLDNWELSQINPIGISAMFWDASSFNQDISSWNITHVTNVAALFDGASSFNQDLSSWCFENIASEPSNFATGSPLDLNPLFKPSWGTCP